MKFLCAKHLELLQQYPSLGLVHWEEWMHLGYDCMSNDKWTQAIHYFGCSYEISEWMLNNTQKLQADYSLSSIDQTMVSGHLLAACFAHTGDSTTERHFLIAVHNHLISAITNSSKIQQYNLHKNVQLSMVMLKRHCATNGNFGGLEACLFQADQMLQKVPQQLSR